MTTTVDEFIADSPKAIQSVLRNLCRFFDELGCDAYVKTIYIGFTMAGEMVAAAYPDGKTVEVALALPEDHPSEVLKDATHLTWKSMPVLLALRSSKDFKYAQPLFLEAHERVLAGKNKDEVPISRYIERNRGRSRFHDFSGPTSTTPGAPSS
jgi:hypothetical protein